MDRVKVPKHDATFSFRAFRERLDKIKPRRQPRGRFRDFRHSEGESKNNLGKYKFLSDLQVKERRKELETQFRNAVIEVENYEGLNQGKDGACTLVSLIHMIWLSGASSKMFSRVIVVLRYRSYQTRKPDSTHAITFDIAVRLTQLFVWIIKDATFLNSFRYVVKVIVCRVSTNFSARDVIAVSKGDKRSRIMTRLRLCIRMRMW